MNFSSESFDRNMDKFWLGKLSDLVGSKQALRRTRSRTLIGTMIQNASSDHLPLSQAIERIPSFTESQFSSNMSSLSSCQSSADSSSCSDILLLDDFKASATTGVPTTRAWKVVLPSVSVARMSFLIMILLASIANVSWLRVDGPQRVSLGSAAISSITEELSPILPFAGGMDLRRSDYWSTVDDDWFGTLKSVAKQVNDAFVQKGEAKKELNRKITPQTSSITEASTKRSKSKHVKSISAPTPFVGVDKIGNLALGEVAVMFRYAIESSRPEFSLSRFVSRLNPKVRQVVQRMEEAVEKSRGRNVVGFVGFEENADEIDALKFCAAMRIFAEWRIVRLVPDGFKGFAVGMSLGHKDVVQNLVKIEDAIHLWLDAQRALYSDDNTELMAPSLREILTYELDEGIHPGNRLPRLTEKTAGMGLLWVSRQLAYQNQLFDNIVHVDKFASSRDAIGAAYKAVYDQYHGWAVQKIFSYSFQAAPEADIVLRYMNPNHQQEATAATVETEQNNFLETLLDTLTGGMFRPQDDEDAEPATGRDAADGTQSTKQLVGETRAQITGYLQVSKPIIDNLQSLFLGLNMDDPTRV